MARASRRMAASPNLPPWFETARIAAKCTQAAPAMARLLTMRPSVLDSCQVAKIERVTASQHEAEQVTYPVSPPCLRLQRCDLGLGARRQHADLAAARVRHDHLHRLARTLQDRDVAGLGTARRQVEQRPLVGRR